MNDLVVLRDRVQQLLADAWDAGRATVATHPGELPAFLGLLEEASAQIDGLRLGLIGQSRYLEVAGRVLDAVVSSPAETLGRLRAQVRLAAVLEDRLPLIRDALREGLISLSQAQAIADALQRAAGSLDTAGLIKCQQELLKQADALGPAELRVLAVRLCELLDPAGAEAAEAARLAAEERRARRLRALRLNPNGHGAMVLTGKLPLAEGSQLLAQLEALQPSLESYHDTDEPRPGREARMADALVLLSQIAANSGELPNRGLDRPHIIITLDHRTLTSGLGAAALPGTLGALGAGDARRLACDAGILPVVLGGPSRPLDVARRQRLFTPAIRTALTLRDGGCAFPGCGSAPAACDAHHIQPWWQGGATTLDNGVLLCPHHHRLIEPDPGLAAHQQWTVHIDESTGLPWFIPPRHIDPARRPRLHRRHLLADLTSDGTTPEQAMTGGGERPPGRGDESAFWEAAVRAACERRLPAGHSPATPPTQTTNAWAQPEAAPDPPRHQAWRPLPGEPGYVNPWHPEESLEAGTTLPAGV